MKTVKAMTKYVRISPKKAFLAAGLIRGLKAQEALVQLKFSSLKGARHLLKTLKSAIANAETREDWKRETLTVSEVRVDEGLRLKRAKARSRGSQVPVIKRTSHFTVVLKQV